MGNEEHNQCTIKDSGQRRKFQSGALRDIDEDKGRTDLMPIDILAPLMDTPQAASVVYHVGEFMQKGQDMDLYLAIRAFTELRGWTISEALIEVSKHYQEGAKKYGERNWEKGIDLHSYIDSGIRHFLKYVDGWNDEPHDRAFIWNMLGAIWTLKHHPELVDIPFTVLRAGHKQDVSQSVQESLPTGGDLLQGLMDSLHAE